jgi:hypothetical protein
MQQHDCGFGISRAEVAHDDRPSTGELDEAARRERGLWNLDVVGDRSVVDLWVEFRIDSRVEVDDDVGLAQTVSTFSTFTVS